MKWLGALTGFLLLCAGMENNIDLETIFVGASIMIAGLMAGGE